LGVHRISGDDFSRYRYLLQGLRRCDDFILLLRHDGLCHDTLRVHIIHTQDVLGFRCIQKAGAA